jgi:predicted DNA-binding transcriptional regulator
MVKLKKSELKVLRSLINNKNKYLKIDYSKLARNIKISRTTVYKATEFLQREGFLKIMPIEDVGSKGWSTFMVKFHISLDTSSEEIENMIKKLEKIENFHTIMKLSTTKGFAILTFITVEITTKEGTFTKEPVWGFYNKIQNIVHDEFKGKIDEIEFAEVITTPKLFKYYSLK